MGVPQHDAKTGTGGEGSPTCGPRAVVGRCGVTVEDRRISTWGVALEIDAAKAVAVTERLASSDAGHAGADGDVGQAGALLKRSLSDAGDAIRDCNAGQAEAVHEGVRPDAGDAAAYCCVGQAGTVLERAGPNADDAVGNGDAGQAGALIERILPDAGDGASYRSAGQGAALECSDPDGGDVGANGNAGQGAIAKRPIPDAGDRVAIDRVGDSQCSGTGVLSGDGDRSVIGGVGEALALHHGGHHQEQEHGQQLRGAGDSNSRESFVGRFTGEGELVAARAHFSPFLPMLPGHGAAVKREVSIFAAGGEAVVLAERTVFARGQCTRLVGDCAAVPGPQAK